MELLVFAIVLTVLLVVTNLFSKEKKAPSGNCKNCPEFRYCGGGRPRCARRNENLR